MPASSGKQPALATPATLEANHRRILVLASAAATVLTLLLTLAAAQQPLFDASPRVLLPPPAGGFLLRLWHALASAVLRWDAFHFASIARDGYAYEHQWAFFPGTPFVLHTVGRAVRAVCAFVGVQPPTGWEEVLLGGLVAAPVLGVLSVLKLYELSLVLLGPEEREAAFLAALVSVLPSSPVTMRMAGYSEPFFTYLSYTGMLHCARKEWLSAASVFAVACAFRSTGIFLSGFILWGMLVEPVLARHKIRPLFAVYALVLSALAVYPFVVHQGTAYRVFCAHEFTSDPGSVRPWCTAFPPSVYTYVQARYWNSGPLLYWTASQIPNFVLAAPPLGLLFAYSGVYLRVGLVPRLSEWARVWRLGSVQGQLRTQPKKGELEEHPDTPDPNSPHPSLSSSPTSSLAPYSSPYLAPALAPHAIHALLMALLWLFASNTQIVLRQAAGLPALYWAAAWLLVERPRVGWWWVGWSVVWGAVCCVLWAAFLPPA